MNLAEASRQLSSRVILRSNYRAVREAVTSVGDALRDAIGEQHTGEVELCLAEALNNVVEHAYKGNPSGEIRVLVALADHVLTVLIEDDGIAMPHAQQIFTRNEAVFEPAEMAEGGYGRKLMTVLMTAVSYERDEGVNKLQMRKTIA